MNPFLALQVVRELGFEPIALNILYKLGLHCGFYRFVSQPAPVPPNLVLEPLFDLPPRSRLLELLGEDGLGVLLRDADEIVSGRFRRFGDVPLPLKLAPPEGLRAHWAVCESRGDARFVEDIKFVWEPARFGWAFTLGRAYYLTGEERFAQSFWAYFEEFQRENPPYLGANWMSGQEVGLRLMAWTWCGQVFAAAAASTSARRAALTQAIAQHAARIPLTLIYARSQNNNHLLSEAVALYTAALALPQHPQSALWLEQGWRWLAWCLENQIDRDGEYVQHSTNYHRVMLQLALWVYALARRENPQMLKSGELSQRPARIPLTIHLRLANATRWLQALLDPISGRACNLGHNDGAYIFPLTVCPYMDYRPVMQAAWLTFVESRPFTPGIWDEMAWWFGVLPIEQASEPQGWHKSWMVHPIKQSGDAVFADASQADFFPQNSVLVAQSGKSWAYLRARGAGNSRPAHADWLHVDLWWYGLNIAQDAGTYLYNAAPPWDNSLTHAARHNTVTLNGDDFYRRVSRFLYLGRYKIGNNAPCAGLFAEQRVSCASHEAYWHRYGVKIKRTVKVIGPDHWEITDAPAKFKPITQSPVLWQVHWLLPDWVYRLERAAQETMLHLESPYGEVILHLKSTSPFAVSLWRAGETLAGSLPAPPQAGWVSPTYAVKQPALSLMAYLPLHSELKFVSVFVFP